MQTRVLHVSGLSFILSAGEREKSAGIKFSFLVFQLYLDEENISLYRTRGLARDCGVPYFITAAEVKK